MGQGRWVTAASAALIGVCGCVTDFASSANSTGDTFASQLPSSVQSSDASKPSSESSAQSSESSQGTSHSSDDSSGNSSKDSSQTESNWVPVLSTVTLTTTTGAIGAVIWIAAAKPEPQVAKAAQAFFQANQFQLQEDLALGAGRSIEDLAALAQIRREHLPEFAHLLHTHREELLSLTDAEALTPKRAVQALRRIGELMANSPVFAEEREAALARMEQADRG